MAGSFSNYLENIVLDHVFGATVYTPSGTLYIALSSGVAAIDDTDTGTTLANSEPAAASGYARIPMVNDKSVTGWVGAVTGSLNNASQLSFAQATGGWGTINQFAVVDALTLGNVLGWGDLTTPRSIVANDTASFASGAIIITLDAC